MSVTSFSSDPDLPPRIGRVMVPRLAALGLGCLLLAIVLYGALAARNPLPTFITVQQDKYEHAIAFIGLGFVFGWRASATTLALFALWLTNLAFWIELLQEVLTTTRVSSLADVAADMAGLFTGLAGAYLVSGGARRTRPLLSR